VQNASIQFTFAGLPGGLEYCFTTPQRFALDITAGLSGYLPGSFNKIINSNTEPSVADRLDSLWFKTSDGRLYYYDGGWKSPNLADANERRIFVGAEADIWSYDGGDGSDPSTTTPTATTGAMWERDTDFDFRFPLGVGTSPAPASTNVSVGGTGGEENHVLTADELPATIPLTATLPGFKANIETGSPQWLAPLASSGVAQTTPANEDGSFPFENTDGGQGHNTMPPYRGVYFVKRTARQFFTP